MGEKKKREFISFLIHIVFKKRKENSSLFLFILCLKILAKIKNKENEPLNIFYTL